VDEPTAESIEAEFPGVRVVTGSPDGLAHATIPHTETWATGEDLQDLRDELIRQRWKRAGAEARAEAGELREGGPGGAATPEPGA